MHAAIVTGVMSLSLSQLSSGVPVKQPGRVFEDADYVPAGATGAVSTALRSRGRCGHKRW